MNEILSELKHNKNELEYRIQKLLNEFEEKWGDGNYIVNAISFRRYNEIDKTFGKIASVQVDLRL